MSDIVAELRRLLDAAPDGRWEYPGTFDDGDAVGYIETFSADGDSWPVVAISDTRPVIDLIVAMHNHLPALLGLVEAVRGHLTGLDVMGDGYLCLALGRLDGRDDHDWSEWSEPGEYKSGWRQVRWCCLCDEIERRRIPPPADDLLERVLLAQLPEDEEDAG